MPRAKSVLLLLLGGAPGWCASGGHPARRSAPLPELRPAVSPAAAFGISRRLDSLPKTPLVPYSRPEPPDEALPKYEHYKRRVPADRALQRGVVADTLPPALSFPGQSNPQACNGCVPPDANGDVGPNHYVQVVNYTLAVYDKSGALQAGFPVPTGNLWAYGLPGSQCAATNSGDPIALYDPLADRWLVSQFSLFPEFHQCLAVSVSPDPAGAWYVYDFLYSTTLLNDYPHFGVWPDGYYAAFNQFLGFGPWRGAGVVAYERDRLLAGDPAARQIRFDLYTVDANFGGMLPADLDGPPPPAGSPAWFAEADPAGIFPGDATASLRLWKFRADWNNPAASTFGQSGQPDHILPVADYNLLCATTRGCIPQPGEPSLNALDALGDRLMHRLQYRNFGDHESLVVNHTVDADIGRAGIRWYEVRMTGGTPAVQQQGTFAPADGLHRWMGSAAMDKKGNLALGFSAAGAAQAPQIRYAGRLAADAPGQLARGEAVMTAGGGTQSEPNGRWGDYSMMAVDPADDCTFWYTQEWYPATHPSNFATMIGRFSFPDCPCTPPPPPPATLSATPFGDNRINVAWSAVAGAQEYHLYRSLGAGGPYLPLAVIALPSAAYADTSVSGGTQYFYRVRAAAPCESADSPAASATATGACTLPPAFAGLQSAVNSARNSCAVSLAWSPAANTCGGAVSYNIYRSQTPGFSPGPANRIAAGITAVSYDDSAALLSDATYRYVVRAQDEAGREEANTVERKAVPTGEYSTGDVTENFEAPGGFDTPGWRHAVITGTQDWLLTTDRSHSPTHSWHAPSANFTSDKTLVSPAFTPHAGSTLKFWHTYRLEPCCDSGVIEISADGGDIWSRVPLSAFTGGGYSCYGDRWCSGIIDAMTPVTAGLSAWAGRSVKLRWRERDDPSVAYEGWYVDSVRLTAVDHSAACASCGGAMPGAPSAPAASATAPNEVTLTWSGGVPAAAGYSVYRALGTCAGAGPFTRIAAGVGGTVYSDGSVSGGIGYAYRIAATDTAGDCESRYSACVQVTATGVCKLAPLFSGLRAVSNAAQGICALNLAWDAAAPLCGSGIRYNIHRSTQPGFTPAPENRIASGVTGTAYHDVFNLNDRTDYYYAVRAVDDPGHEDGNLAVLSGAPTGFITPVTRYDSFEGGESGGGFDLPGWTHAGLSGNTDWVWSTGQAQSPTHAWFGEDLPRHSDSVLESPPFLARPGTELSFWHTWGFEPQGYDGGTLEVYSEPDPAHAAARSGPLWSVLPASAFTAGGYNGVISFCCGNPLGGKPGWVDGTPGVMTESRASLAAYAGQTLRLRWHQGNDGGVAAPGWWVDSVSLSDTGSAAVCTNPCFPNFEGLGAAADGGQPVCTVTLSWSPAVPRCGSAVTYNIYRSDSPGFIPAPANRVASGVTGAAYSDVNGLTDGRKVYYIVRAVNTLGNEEANGVERPAVPRGPPGGGTACACPAPSGQGNNSAGDADDCAANGTVIQWPAPASWGDGGAGARRWSVLRGGAPLASGACAGSLPETTHSCIDDSAVPGLSYNYRVSGMNGCGTAAITGGAGAADLDHHLTAPVDPVRLIKGPGGVTAVFTWGDLAGAAGYAVYQDTAAGGAFTALIGTASGGNPGLIVPMPAGATLFFRVAAVNGCGEGPK